VRRVLVVDNHDSFTWNLVQYLEILGARCEVVLNDAVDVAEARERDVDAILISPGPCTPDDAGVSLALIEAAAGRLPILGVCLGHQALAQVFGGKVVRAARPMHGKTSPIEHDGATLFEGIERPFEATRYHSLVVERATLPDCLAISAWTKEGEIMGLRHREHAIEGVQFHPESILTPAGAQLARNFLASARA
jgi:anthranilate synthase/aminodeoxychorismate synthase-like glutamine amidotransferase